MLTFEKTKTETLTQIKVTGEAENKLVLLTKFNDEKKWAVQTFKDDEMFHNCYFVKTLKAAKEDAAGFVKR